jgi:hypothetical protein
MANLTGRTTIFSGITGVVDTTAQHKVLTRAMDESGNEYIYLAGVSSTAIGSWVTYDEAGATTLLVANAVGPIAVATVANTSSSAYAWYLIFGSGSALLAANCADNAFLGYETSSGYAGDGCAAGDCITGAISRGATSGSAALATVQLNFPSVNDKSA